MLVIQMRDGVPYEHPIMLENMYAVFPEFDENNLPEGFAYFERIPFDGSIEVPFDKAPMSRYVVGDDGVVRDVWELRPLTDEEYQIKLAQRISDNISVRSSKIEEATIIMNTMVDNSSKKLFNDYIDKLNLLDLNVVDVQWPAFPLPQQPPIEVINAMPGSAPDVI